MKVSSLRRSAFDDGVWRELAEFGIEVLVRSSEHPDYRRAVQAGMQPHAKRIRNGGMVDPVQQDRITCRAVAKHLLLGWKGVEDDDGAAVEFTRERAAEWAEDPEYTQFFKAIERLGDELAAGQAEDRAELGKS